MQKTVWMKTAFALFVVSSVGKAGDSERVEEGPTGSGKALARGR